MTNQEINLKIAEIEGHIPYQVINGEVYSLYEDGSRCDLLDFINNWNLLGPLVLKLGKAGWLYCLNSLNREQWVKNGVISSDEDFGKATCLAYIKEFGDEK